MDTKARPSRKKRRSWAFPLGLLVIVLVVAGVVAIVGAGVSGVKGVVERRENAMKEEYQKFIAPVIMNDPSPFDDLSQADIGQLMEAAVWSLLRSDPDPENGIQVTIRRTLGADINASCGQLRRGYLSRQREENV